MSSTNSSILESSLCQMHIWYVITPLIPTLQCLPVTYRKNSIFKMVSCFTLHIPALSNCLQFSIDSFPLWYSGLHVLIDQPFATTPPKGSIWQFYFFQDENSLSSPGTTLLLHCSAPAVQPSVGSAALLLWVSSSRWFPQRDLPWPPNLVFLLHTLQPAILFPYCTYHDW